MTKQPLHPAAKSGKPLSAKRFAPALQIELVHTTDDPAHGPNPPLGDGWHLARSTNGVTLWRRIQFPLRSRLSVAAGPQVSARATTNCKGDANGNP